ncbi:class I SAM-dependent methyltransferase [Nonomuraea sp. SYSU D8015]|uniref:class I SAM-dependent methyltransferase n=1 Tax=Nonomuraea sp. SYSU D8015 TaxID=2593644 RepID=UPI001660DA52|nr:class I SAM-dependent methyltransferase [Nonomuraea sp. SYSU D8015]
MGDHVIVVDEDRETGQRLKYYSKNADVDYWTTLWASKKWTYDRQLKGYLPRYLRDTFLKWVRPGARVLEAGCGIAHFTVAAHALGYRAEGLDWSEQTIHRLKARFPGISWHVGDVRKLEFDDGVFDAVYSPGVCEHFEEGPTQILAETRRILSPSGIAVIVTPCYNRWLQARAHRLFAGSVPVGHFYQYAFSSDGITGLLRRIGFEVLQVRHFGTLETLMEFGNWRLPRRLQRPLHVMDYLPVFQQWGRCCVWVARRPALATPTRTARTAP